MGLCGCRSVFQGPVSQSFTSRIQTANGHLDSWARWGHRLPPLDAEASSRLPGTWLGGGGCLFVKVCRVRRSHQTAIREGEWRRYDMAFIYSFIYIYTYILQIWYAYINAHRKVVQENDVIHFVTCRVCERSGANAKQLHKSELPCSSKWIQVPIRSWKFGSRDNSWHLWHIFPWFSYHRV